MSLQDDFNDFKTGINDQLGNYATAEEAYIRKIWEETEIDAAVFKNLRGSYNFQRIKQAVNLDSMDASEFRKRMYGYFLEKLNGDPQQREQFGIWLNCLECFVVPNERPDFLAKYITRVLRGELCSQPRQLAQIRDFIRQNGDVWSDAFCRLKNLCDNLRIS